MEGNSHALGFNGSGSSRHQKSIWVKFITPLGGIFRFSAKQFSILVKIEGDQLVNVPVKWAKYKITPTKLFIFEFT